MRLLTLAEAAKLFPTRNGRHPHIVSIRRRILRGSHGVKLRAVRDGRDWFTSAEWIQEFQDSCTRRAMPGESKVDAQFAAWQHEQAKRRLKERYGFDVDPNATVANLESEAEVLDVQPASGSSGVVPGVLRGGVARSQRRKPNVGRTRRGRPGQPLKARQEAVPVDDRG